MFARLINFIKSDNRREKFGGFSDFFLHASEREKKEIIKEAAYKANEEQREILNKASLKTKSY